MLIGADGKGTMNQERSLSIHSTNKNIQSIINTSDIAPSYNGTPRFDYDAELSTSLQMMRQGDSLTDEQTQTVACLVMSKCNQLNSFMTVANGCATYRAYQVGQVLIELRSRMTTMVHGRRSRKAYRAFINAHLEEYVKAALANDEHRLTRQQYKMKAKRLAASRRRQINKYIELAQCPEEILEFAFAGIEAVLEVRWLLRDILVRRSTSDEAPKLDSEEGRSRMRELLTKYPFPRLNEVTGVDTRTEFRHHVDMLGTIYELNSPGMFHDDDIDTAAALSYATLTGETIEPERAKMLWDRLKNGDPEHRREELTAQLQALGAEVAKAKTIQKPERIAELLAKIVDWQKNHSGADAINKVRELPSIADQLDESIDILTQLIAQVEGTVDENNA